MRTHPYINSQSAIPIDSIRSVVSYTLYLIMKGQMSGNLAFDGRKAIQAENDISRRLQELSDQLSACLSACKENEIADLLEC